MQVSNLETIVLSRTFSESTPESVEHGDFSDTGFICEGDTYDMVELVDMVAEHSQHSSSEVDHNTWTSCDWYTTCYKTGTEREESLHLKSTDSLSKAIWVAALKGELTLIEND